MYRFLFLLALLAPALAPADTLTEAELRKARSIAILDEAGVPHIDHLPVIETEAESVRRTEREVVERLVALAIVAVKGETGDHQLGLNLLEQFGAKSFLSPAEATFMADPTPSQQDLIDFSWRYEGVWVLLWAIGAIDETGPADRIADVPHLARLLREAGTKGLLERAKLRPQSEILDAADLIYRQDWAVVNARLDGTAMPPGLDPGIVYERHYVLNWLIGYSGQAWDDVTTDT